MALAHVGHRISNEIARKKQHGEKRKNAQKCITRLQLHVDRGTDTRTLT
jgi:hypothetical protein